MNLGAHMSIAGGVYKALERGASIGCNVVQLFTKNQTRWSSPPLKEQDIRQFIDKKSDFFSIFAHTSYLINLASPDKTLFRKSVDTLTDELNRCHVLGIPLLVLHPGFHKGQGEVSGIKQIASGLKYAYDQSSAMSVKILLETTSGQGSVLGYRFEHLRDIIDIFGSEKAGVCLDTCHIFSAGYDIRDSESYKSTWQEFNSCLGMNVLKAVHLNDSKGDLGSGIDRHEHIGRGRIGLTGFKLIMTDSHIAHIPMCLETPKGPDLNEDVDNLALLRSLKKDS